MAGNIEGTLISGITGFGASEDASHAYIEVQINDQPGTHYLMFRAEEASGIVSAFIAATSHVHQLRTEDENNIAAPFPIESFSLSLGKASDGSSSSVLSAVLKSGAKLHLLAPNAALVRLHAILGSAIQKLGGPEPIN